MRPPEKRFFFPCHGARSVSGLFGLWRRCRFLLLVVRPLRSAASSVAASSVAAASAACASSAESASSFAAIDAFEDVAGAAPASADSAAGFFGGCSAMWPPVAAEAGSVLQSTCS